MKKLITLLAVVFFLSHKSYSQDFNFGAITGEDLSLQRYEKDSSAAAVVLKEFGTASILSTEETPLIFKYHVRIKIFNSKGLNQGNVSIPLYKSDNERFEEIRGLKASTFNNSPNGVQETALDQSQIFRENKNKHWDIVKFAFPDLRDGSIIEYSYELSSPYKYNFRNWDFQSDIPKIHSEYIAIIPAIYQYNVSLKGPYKLTKSNAEFLRECFNYNGLYKCDCSKMTYIMTDIPAFVEEDYMTAASNFKSAINFELSEYVNYRGIKIKLTKEWKDVDYELKTEPRFADQIKRKDFLKDKLPAVIKDAADETARARAVYYFIRNSFRWNGFYDFFSEGGIKKAFEAGTGNIADINLTLLAALKAAGLDAEAVLLSTRENGVVRKLFPVLSDFNYVIAKVNIGEQSYLLDATDPLLPFGMLPLRCLNDQGRVISFNKPSYWLDLKPGRKSSKVYTLNLALGDDGKIRGEISCFSNGYEAYDKRKSMKEHASLDEYVESMDEKMPKVKILHYEILNADSAERPLAEKYEVVIDAFDNLNKDKLMLNPFVMERLAENPFKLTERTYPVDLGTASESKSLLTLSFPEKFEVTGKPAVVGLALPGNGGRFVTQFDVAGNTLTYSQMTEFSNAIYGPDSYPYLKELFNKIIQAEKTDIIFQKKL